MGVDDGEEYLTADGFEDALIGFVWPASTGLKTAVYDSAKCISILMERDKMDEDTAIEFFNFNTLGAYVGPQTPLFLESSNLSASSSAETR